MSSLLRICILNVTTLARPKHAFFSITDMLDVFIVDPPKGLGYRQENLHPVWGCRFVRHPKHPRSAARELGREFGRARVRPRVRPHEFGRTSSATSSAARVPTIDFPAQRSHNRPDLPVQRAHNRLPYAALPQCTSLYLAQAIIPAEAHILGLGESMPSDASALYRFL